MSLSRYFRPKDGTSDIGMKDPNDFSSHCTKQAIIEGMHSDATPTYHNNNVNDTPTSTLPPTIDTQTPATKSDLVIDSGSSLSPACNFDLVVVETNTAKQQEPQLPTINRFAKWAHRSQELHANQGPDQSKNTSSNAERPIQVQHYAPRVHPTNRTIGIGNQTIIRQKRPRSTTDHDHTTGAGGATTTASFGSKSKNDFVPMNDLPESERQAEIEKWHSITSLFTSPYHSSDVPYTIEDRRFHMVLATLLHTRCQEPSVRVAIIQLVNYFQRHDVPVTVSSMVDHCRNDAIDVQSNLVSLIKNLQYYNTKVKYISQSSKYILDHFNGIVPRTEKELLRLPGIGPLFADLLSTINTNKLHEQYMEQHDAN